MIVENTEISEERERPFHKGEECITYNVSLNGSIRCDEGGHTELDLPEMGAPTMEADPRNKISSPKALVSCDSPRS